MSALLNSAMVSAALTTTQVKKLYTKKTVEQKIINAEENKQFVKICLENGKFNYDDKVRLTSKTFKNKSEFVLLYSCRMIGTLSDLTGYFQQGAFSSELRELMEIDLKQAINAVNCDELTEIDVYSFGVRPEGGYTVLRSRTATRKSLVSSELSFIRSTKLKADMNKSRRCLDISHLASAVYILTNCFSSIQQYPIQKKSKEINAPPKKNLLVTRVEESITKGHFLDISQCSESGGNTHKSDKAPANACFVHGVLGLKNVYFVPTRDTNPRSPTHGVTNVGALNFVAYYFEHAPGHASKSYAQCKEIIAMSFSKNREEKVLAVSTPKPKPVSTISLSALGLDEHA